MSYYGAHMSIKNGIITAIDEINELGGNMIQIFVSNPMSKAEVNMKKYNQIAVTRIRNKLTETNSKIVIHLPYVINLAKPLPPNPIESWWIKMICNQLDVSELIGSIGCVVHVGKALELLETDAIDNMYNGLKFVIDYLKSKNMSTWIILETAAGQGTELITTKNNSLEEFSSFYNRFSEEDKNYIKICVDTCHIYAAGYDISTEEEVRTFFQEFDEQIGLDNLGLIHLNDSKLGNSCGCCVDRHANLGKGMIGLVGLKEFIRLGLYHKIPIILETPDGYVEEIKMITKLRNL